jgi:hypothetical protein
MRYKIIFNDEIEANSEDDAYDKLLEYLQDCVDNGDVTAFNFVDEEGNEF